MIKGEEDMVFLVHVDRQLDLYLCTAEQVAMSSIFHLHLSPVLSLLTSN